MAYLDDHPPARSQFKCPRRAGPSGVVVVHTAENTPDFVAFDGGAEAVARFIQGRADPGSYHDLCDSDSAIQLVRYECEAFHDGTGSNPHSYGVSAATRHDVWPLAPASWRAGCIRQMAASAARYARWLKARTGIVIPARRITRAQSEARVPGFISHAERDPTRRKDPGTTFPWVDFLTQFDQFFQEDDVPLTDDDIRKIRLEAVREELNYQAKLIRGISSLEVYLDALLDAARQGTRYPSADQIATAVVAALPEGSVDVAQIEQAMHRVLAGTVGRLEFTATEADG